ncbi:hypothetical protein GGI24_005647, partial [Coemansia furcata]
WLLRARRQATTSSVVLREQSLTNATSDAPAALGVRTFHARQKPEKHRKRSGSGEGKRKSVLAAAMVPSLVASSIGIGMSTSAMPPNKMTIEDLVDQELERQTEAADKPADSQ